jgi:hypothetical protein
MKENVDTKIQPAVSRLEIELVDKAYDPDSPATLSDEARGQDAPSKYLNILKTQPFFQKLQENPIHTLLRDRRPIHNTPIRPLDNHQSKHTHNTPMACSQPALPACTSKNVLS